MMSALLQAYLSRLARELRKHGLKDRRIVEEAREHLVDAIDEGLQRGLSVDAAEREAFVRFGPPETVAAHFATERYPMVNRLLVSLTRIARLIRRGTQVIDGAMRAAVDKVGSELFTIVHKSERARSQPIERIGSSGKTRTCNPPVNSVTQVFGLAGFRAGSSDGSLLISDVRERIGQRLARRFDGAVLSHLPDAVRPAVRFAYLTGWRMKSEVLSLTWKNVDFNAGQVRLEPGTTKNKEGRTFPFTPESDCSSNRSASTATRSKRAERFLRRPSSSAWSPTSAAARSSPDRSRR
jgi:hypothetical protein